MISGLSRSQHSCLQLTSVKEVHSKDPMFKRENLVNLALSVSPDLNPMPTEEIVQMFNELRSDLVLLYELKQAHSNCEYEQQMLRHRYEALLKAGGSTGSGVAGSGLTTTTGGDLGAANISGASLPGSEAQTWPSADDIKVEAKEQIIDVVGAPLTPNSVSLWSCLCWRRNVLPGENLLA